MIIIGWIVKKVAGLLVRRSLARGGGLTEQRATVLAKAALVVAAVVLLVAGWLVLDHLNDKAAVERASARAVAAARAADAKARAAVDSSLNSVESSNEQARRAAAGSDDPLADGLRAIE